MPGLRTPWHQDQPYYNISGQQNCSFWIPVDPVGRESTPCMPPAGWARTIAAASSRCVSSAMTSATLPGAGRRRLISRD